MLKTKFDVIRELKSRNYSAKEIAVQIGVNKRIAGKLEEGHAPGIKMLTKLCKAFNCQPGDIIEWVPDEKTIYDRKTLTEVASDLPMYADIRPGEITFKLDVCKAVWAAGYTQREASDRGVLNHSTRTDITKGRFPGIIAIAGLCNGLRCQPGDLIEYNPEEE